KAQHANENPADVKAAEKMAKLFDVIKKDNPDDSQEFNHGLNVFLSRLLFCFFAEDTHIFEDCQFSNVLDSHTQADGSDLDFFFDRFFSVLNTPGDQRVNLPDYLMAFPFVNGGLFRDNVSSPEFSRSSRAAVLASGDQDWSAINPDIFGSMFQAVISTEQRGSLGQHYTSVPNIMKVIEPLFLNELYVELEKAGKSKKKLVALLQRIHNIKIFDPACGSGNFLIIAYKELRLLEMKIFKAGGMIALSGIQLSQFYGIELDDFAGEIAKLALWLAEHQMNVEFYNEFGRTNPTLPLSEAGHIVQGNATRLNWEEVCPKNGGDEIHILGNPPYLGYSRQTVEQKLDMEAVFSFVDNFKKLDYITCWFYKGAKYIRGCKSKLAFVTTNSVCQGIQVALLWPTLYKEQIEIGFSHLSFKWKNNAKSNAGVYVIIIGLRNVSTAPKFIFTANRKLFADNINAYLANSKNIIVTNRNKALSDLPLMLSGLKAGDDGNLILSENEKDDIIDKFPNSIKYIKKYIGAKDFMNSVNRFCIWVRENEYADADRIAAFNKRFENLRKFRLASKKVATQRKAVKPYAFDETNLVESNLIMIPQTGSERRDHLPLGFLNSGYVISNGARAIYNAEPWIFGMLSSKMHITWVKAVAGRLKMDMQYSNTLCYNTFPFPPISTQRKNEITQAVFRILEEREKHPDRTIAQLYDPDKMPNGLREAHHQNDIIIEKCYRSTPFSNDEERLEYLFKLYEKKIEEEKNKNTLFEVEKKKRKKKK
ncbi:MAG: class I SAM-dependent DNA methyltransferase, partial [Deltaproteobacteria bacterium]|nr:class I SAM-dependent DNA methyltransferase [Deltaproteobacteria bacterium]